MAESSVSVIDISISSHSEHFRWKLVKAWKVYFEVV